MLMFEGVISYFAEKTGKEGRNGDDDDTTSVMSFESSVVSFLLSS